MIRYARSRCRAAILFATATVATQACSTERGEVGTNPTPNPTPSISISIDVTSATVVPGESVAIGAKLTGRGGFTGAGVSFDLTGAPAGITFAVSNLQTSGSVTTATITLSVAATVQPETYTMNLIGSGTGVSPVSVPFAVTVTKVGFTLSANPATLTPCEGCGAVTATITINRISSFTGSVALSVTIPVTGGEQGGSTTATLNPTSTTGNSSILTVSTNAAPGNYTLTITGTAPGFTTQTVTIAVAVP